VIWNSCRSVSNYTSHHTTQSINLWSV